jgi:ubiquitin-conjugating enzyme E2 Z
MACLRRLKREIKEFNDESVCIRDGTFAKYSDTNIKEAYAMIIGPDDTPYEGGFFFFKINFNDDYPFNPPKAKYLTQGNNIRFNPNLYTNGKVCLSILGTWSGPSWSALYNLKTILTSLRGQVLVENPLVNEPGYEKYKKSCQDCISYNSIVSFGTTKFAIIEALKGNLPIPKEYHEYFQNIINEYFKNNYQKYVDRFNKLKSTDNNKQFSCKYQSQNQTPKYDDLIDSLGAHYISVIKK